MAEGFLRFAEVSMGRGGLPSCVRCGAPSTLEPRPGADIIAEAFAAIASWDDPLLGPGPNVLLAGGEPFSHPELPSIVFAIAEARVARVCVRTAGEALSVAENAAGLVHAGVRLVELVLLADGDTHDALAGRPGSFARASQGARSVKAAAGEQHVAVALSGRVPVCRHNLEQAPDAVAALSALGASHVVLEVDDAAAGSVGAAPWIASACDTGVVNGTWVSVRSSARLAGVPDLHLVPVTSLAAKPGAGVGGAG